MIETIHGDLFSVEEGHIVHGCNSWGVMGSGVAKTFKERFPDSFNNYYRECNTFKKAFTDNPHLGMAFAHREGESIVTWCAITQLDYGTSMRHVNYEAVDRAFSFINRSLLGDYYKNIPKVVNFPMIGAGLGGGDWDIISTIIDKRLDDSIKKRLYIYER